MVMATEDVLMLSILGLGFFWLVIAVIYQWIKTAITKKLAKLRNDLNAKDEDLNACVSEHKEMCNLVLELKTKLTEKEEEIVKLQEDKISTARYYLEQKDVLQRKIGELNEALVRQSNAIGEAEQIVLKTQETIKREREERNKLEAEYRKMNTHIIEREAQIAKLNYTQASQEWVDRAFRELFDYASEDSKKDVRGFFEWENETEQDTDANSKVLNTEEVTNAN